MRGRRSSSETRPSRRAWTPRPSPASTRPRSACSPSTRDAPTPVPTATARSCTKADGRSSGLKCWRPCGRRSTMTGPRDPRTACPSGSASAQARRLVTQRLPRARKRKWVVETPPLRKRKSMKRRRRRKKKRKKRSKKFLTFCDVINHGGFLKLDKPLCSKQNRTEDFPAERSSLHHGGCRPLHTSYIPNI